MLPAAGPYVAYLRVQTAWAAQPAPSLWHPVDYLVWRQAKRLFDGICYGILLALLVYNLALAGIFRDPTRAVVADGLTLTAIPQLCSDGMSDRLFGMRAHVVIHGDTPRMLSGCCSIQP